MLNKEVIREVLVLARKDTASACDCVSHLRMTRQLRFRSALKERNSSFLLFRKCQQEWEKITLEWNRSRFPFLLLTSWR